jgi:hypothetical protein
MGKIYTTENVGTRVSERDLKPGQRLWAAGDKVSGDAYRQGNSPANAAIYLRWRDLNVIRQGKIETEDAGAVVVNPGQGLSLFIEKIVHADFNHIASTTTQSGKAALSKLASERGYNDAHQIHWFKLEEGKVMPVGLEVIFDNEPPGHCTLTVSRGMTVREFLDLVHRHLGFTYVGTDIFGVR